MYRHYEPSDALAAFVVELPKTETHLHFEGSLSYEQLQVFDPERYPESPPFWDPDFRYSSFDHFQAMFDDWILPYYDSIERYQQTARHVLKECQKQGCRYVETSFHLPAVEWLDGDGIDLLAAMSEVIPDGLEVRFFGGMMHNDYSRNASLLESALEWEHLAGFDLQSLLSQDLY